MEFRVLGPLEVLDGEGRIEIAGRKERALLVALALRAGEPVPTSQLVETLWDDAPPRTVTKVLQTYVFRLRRALTSRALVETRGDAYLLAVRREQVDALRFEDLVAAARKAWQERDVLRTSSLLGEALALWRADVLGDEAHTAAARAQVVRFSEMHLSAVEDRIEADLALGAHTELVGELEAMVATNPFRERVWGLLMVALYRSGRQAEALRTYGRARTTLVEALGVEPSPWLRELEASVLVQDPKLDLAGSPRMAQPGGTAHARGAAPRRTIPAAQARAEIVGRRRERAQLAGALESARRGRGSLFLLTGEPGIGKTRLAEDVADRARDAGFLVAWGAAWEAGGAPPLWPWIQALGCLSEALNPEALAAATSHGAHLLVDLIPALAERATGDSDSPADVTSGHTVVAASEQARFDLFDAVTRFVRDAARHRPVLLVLDDMHAADATSLLLLQFLARQVRDASLVVVATSREVEARLVPWVAESLAGATRFGHRLPLRGLADHEVRELVNHIGDVHATPEVVTEVHAATGGNPFFVDELVRLLAAEGGLRPGRATPAVPVDLPGGVRETVLRRLSPLSDDSRAVLRTASVIGRHFDLSVLHAASGRALVELAILVHEAVALDLVVPNDGSSTSFGFVHALVRDCLYEEQSASDRAERHWRVAEALEQSPSGSAAELAHHFRAARPVGGSAMAVRYSLAAAEQAMERLAFEDAVRQYRHALEALDATAGRDALQRCRILLALNDACTAAGAFAERKGLVVEAAALARSHDDPVLLAEAARRAPVLRSDGEPAITLVTDALALLPPGPSHLRVLLLQRLAWAEVNSTFSERSGRTLREALKEARALGDAEVLIETLASVDHLVPYEPEEHSAAAAELAQVAMDARSAKGLLSAHMFRIREMLANGNLAGFDDELSQYKLLANERRHAPAVLFGKQLTALRLMLAGRFAEAEAVALEVLALEERAGTALRELPMFHLRMEQGRFDELEPLVRRLVVESPQYPWRPRLAALLSEQGRIDDARAEFEILAEHGFADVHGIKADFVLPLLAETCAFLGDRARAEILQRRLTPAAARCVVVGGRIYACTGAVVRYLGLLDAALGRWDDAERHLREALARHEAMPSPPLVARTQHDLAAMLAQRGRRADRDLVRSLASDSLAAAERMGMRRLADKAASLIAGPRGAGRPTRTSVGNRNA